MPDLILYTIEGKSLEAVEADLRDAAARHRMAIFAQIDLQAAVREQGVAFGHPCRLFELSSPGLAAEVLARDPALTAILPCRISLHEWQGQLRLTTVKPTSLLAHFPGIDLESVLRQFERELTAVLDEAAA
ncbi:MAG TPA: DUF302 domain-containing protein [Terriglobales bacterium]|nr:DUF302 domain-containing protein [Terriglobales bacterium]